MKRAAYLDATYTQTEGETTCIINGQFQFPSGLDILQKRQFFKERFDWVRKAVMCEPRGHNDLYGGVIVPSSTSAADVGVIWIDGAGYGDMCGHGTIAASMVLYAFDLSPLGLNKLRLETPAGIVTSEVESENEYVTSCRFQNVPAFLAETGIPVALPVLGETKVDIAFGGNYFITVPLPTEVCRVAPENAVTLVDIGMAAKRQINDKIALTHPEKPHINEIDLVTLYQRSESGRADYRWVHVYRNGKMDRSPGGSGTSAMLAMLEAKGEIMIGDTLLAEGLLGTGTFEGQIIGETTVGGSRAVVPTVKGRSTIIGFAKWFLDPMEAAF